VRLAALQPPSLLVNAAALPHAHGLRISRRPTVKLGLHPRYPRPWPFRGQIGSTAIRQARPRPAQPAGNDSENTLILALTAQITHLKKQHRDETQALRAALEQAHGENLQLRRELTRLGWTGQPSAT
jgi:hypothetical protein